MQSDPKTKTSYAAADADDFQENASTAFPPERSYPVGSLIIPHQKMSQYTVGVGLHKQPSGHVSDKVVQVHPRLLWTVVEYRSGWTKIVSADGQHAGWHFHVRDKFQLFETYAKNCERDRAC